jgi:3-oxoacyl-[acyl-carrier-protein] synthase II
MNIYITGTGIISPQETFEKNEGNIDHQGNRLTCIEPNYKEILDPKSLRRMSRVIRMGSAAAIKCLQDAGMNKPAAIITGTAYGCLEDTGVFLSKMVEQKEELLTPTAFIQSTHNTVGAQIALMLNCHGYNNTFVHRGFSFETALQDAMMLLKEDAAPNVLVGGIDEITDQSFEALTRIGLLKKEKLFTSGLINSQTKGTFAGEGAAFFLLTKEPTSHPPLARLEGIKTFYKPSGFKAIEDQVNSFLTEHSLSPGNIDLLITGNNGDVNSDKIYKHLSAGMFGLTANSSFKQQCGEYPTATAFALSIAIRELQNKRRVLIYNHNHNIHHSLILVSS